MTFLILVKQEEMVAIERNTGIRFIDWQTWPRNMVVLKVKDRVLSQRIVEIAGEMRTG